MNEHDTRTEHDAMGTVTVPSWALWGAQTERARHHFQISTERMPEPILMALARCKRAAARANLGLGLLAQARADAIAQAATEVLAGLHAEAFPLSLWQSGSGTQSHMNMNEVLARRASSLLATGGDARPVHPNDEVNLGQSSNDIFPTAMHLAALSSVLGHLLPSLQALQVTLRGQAGAHANLLKIGRTHLQDATPLSVGQEVSGWLAQLVHAEQGVRQSLPALHQLAVGGTAVGTGLNTAPGFAAQVVALLSAETGWALRETRNHFAAQAAHDALVHAHGALKTLAVALMKLANDLRWLASGPRCGLGEWRLPENEPGSSIMPGKVNPSQCEALLMACTQVLGNDVTMGIAGAAGHLQLNTCKPLLAHCFLQSSRLLADAMVSFDLHCARGMSPDPARIADWLGRSLMLVTALSPHIGYDQAAAIARHAQVQGVALREAAIGFGRLSGSQFDEWVQAAYLV